MSRAAMVTASGMRTGLSVVAMLALMAVSILYLGSVGLERHRQPRRAYRETRTAGNQRSRGRLARAVSRRARREGDQGAALGHRRRCVVELQEGICDSEDSRFRVDNLSALGETCRKSAPRGGGGPALSDGVRLATSGDGVPPPSTNCRHGSPDCSGRSARKKVRAIIDRPAPGLVPDRELLETSPMPAALLPDRRLTTRGSPG